MVYILGALFGLAWGIISTRIGIDFNTIDWWTILLIGNIFIFAITDSK